MFYKNNIVDQRKRKQYENTESFFICCSLLEQAQFSNYLNYFLFVRRFNFFSITKQRNHCIFSGYRRSVVSSFKFSRHVFARKVLTGSMPGFYRSVW